MSPEGTALWGSGRVSRHPREQCRDGDRRRAAGDMVAESVFRQEEEADYADDNPRNHRPTPHPTPGCECPRSVRRSEPGDQGQVHPICAARGSAISIDDQSPAVQGQTICAGRTTSTITTTPASHCLSSSPGARSLRGTITSRPVEGSPRRPLGVRQPARAELTRQAATPRRPRRQRLRPPRAPKSIVR